MAAKIVGVDIGSTYLRAIELENPKKPKPTITRFHEVPLPEGSVKRGEVLEVNTVASAFRTLWAAGQFSTKDVVLGIGGQSVVSRELTVPRMPLQQIREALPFQVQDLLPMPVDDAVLDFYPIAEEPGDGAPLVRGLFVAAAKQAVMANVTAATTAGLNPVQVDLLPFARARANTWGEKSQELVAQIDVGGNTTSVVIVDAGVPQFVRTIPAGGDDTTRAIAHALGIRHDEAEAAKIEFGGPGGAGRQERQFVEVIYGATAELLTSIRNTLSYYLGSHPHSSFGRIILSGGGARLAGFRSALGEMARVPITTVDPFGQVAMSRKVEVAATPEKRDELTLALGLALGSAA